ncbi:DUF2997 domain-containing protein [Isoptericola sp. NPDC056618]|uniref:DUF2997 domain-containing protein n=1 Tax=Isoptericola sp. NPDC056618 TaxID=3345878 RepID=UPI0036B6E398
MTAEQIIVIVGPDGSLAAETKGMAGPKCLDSSALLEDLLDARTVTSKFTEEYDQTTLERETDDELRQQ